MFGREDSSLDIQQVSTFVMNNMMYLTGGLGVLVVIMYAIIINLWMNVSYMKKRYRKMMTGVDGQNLERMLIGHIEETQKVVKENQRIDQENKAIAALLQKALTRVGVVRFRAFEDMGSDLSYAVALLDAENNGVILSSIFGREDSRSYVKPIEGGKSTYTLTDEEQQALQKAMGAHRAREEGISWQRKKRRRRSRLRSIIQSKSCRTGATRCTASRSRRAW